MKISKRDINLLIALAGILTAFLAYQFGYLKTMEKAQELEAQNASLRTEIARLETIAQHRDTYEEETAGMEEQIEDWMSEFPSNVLPEDDIKLSYRADNRSIGQYIVVNGFDFVPPALLYTTNQSAAAPAAEPAQDAAGEDVLLEETPQEEGPAPAEQTQTQTPAQSLYPTFYLYRAPVNLGVECNYAGIKSLLRDIYGAEYRKGIDNVTLAYDDETGMLEGSVAMNSYYVMGLDRPYSPPDLTPVGKGTADFFKTLGKGAGLTDGGETDTGEADGGDGGADGVQE